MKIAIVPVSIESRTIARKLQKALSGETKLLARGEVKDTFHEFDAFIFVSALGICVRTIAPVIKDKYTDPAVVCVDSTGKNVIAVLSGHKGGANQLTKEVAAVLGANPVITTQSDNQGLWALDTFEEQFDWVVAEEKEDVNAVIFQFVNKKPVALYMDIRDRGTDYLENTLPPHVTIVKDVETSTLKPFRALIVVSPFRVYPDMDIPCVHFIPKVITYGIGLAHQAGPALEVMSDIDEVVEAHGMFNLAREYCTIDVKADEPVIKLLQTDPYPVRFFTAEELAKVEVPTPSEVVSKHVGTPSVCEAAAILGSNYGKLLLTKQKGKNFTVAVAIDRKYLREGHVEIVGAGPGDPDLVSVRGRRLLERADLILYAGSLVPKELTLCAKPGATVRSSADMSLEEQCDLMKDFYDKGKYIVRLHTGDPCIFGAIQEQMAFFDKHGMDYHITPGISSFLAAAAELRSQFTIPERCQTIILTRGEGRTPMPEKEKLHLLARSQSTMCIFLSAAIVDDVQRELLQEYPEDTPVAACYHLTWKDQRIYRGVLKDLAKMVHDNNLTLTTMLVVGEAIDNRSENSKLYDKRFTHLFRKGKNE
jgi:precorrin-4 C11-methyltransferase